MKFLNEDEVDEEGDYEGVFAEGDDAATPRKDDLKSFFFYRLMDSLEHPVSRELADRITKGLAQDRRRRAAAANLQIWRTSTTAEVLNR